MSEEKLINYMLLVGSQFEDIYGHKHYLKEVISSGGQGAVFQTADPNIAVKIGFSEGSENDAVLDDSRNDEFNKIRLLPLPEKINLTLPKATLKGLFGYVMVLLDDMGSFTDALNSVEPAENEWLCGFSNMGKQWMSIYGKYIASGSSRRRLELFMRFAGILAQLHGAGLVFCDVSLNNVFASKNLNKYNVWLIDCDNVNYQVITSSGGGVYTPGYAAPEVVEEGEMTMYSDCYAFAECFFHELTKTHPFRGKREEELFEQASPEEAEDQLFRGYEPWIFDKQNDSNRADNTAVIHDFVLTDKLMELFDRTFSELGRFDIFTRPTMPEWGEAIADAADNTIMCPKCQMSSIYKNGVCQWCDKKISAVKIESYFDKTGLKPFWSFTHEFDKEINIPMRLFDGFSVTDIDRNAFVLKQNESGFSAVMLDRDWKMTDLKFDGINGGDISYGGFKFKETFSFEAVHKGCGDKIFVKGRIIK